MTVKPEPDRDLRLQGHYAGIVTRLAAFAIDAFLITALFALGGQVVAYVLSSLLGHPFASSDAPIVSGVALLTWAFFYCAYPLAVAGRTFGMAILGLIVSSYVANRLASYHTERALVGTLVLIMAMTVLYGVLKMKRMQAAYDANVPPKAPCPTFRVG